MSSLTDLIPLLLLGLVVAAYVCSENLGGRVPEPWSRLGYLVLLPGYLVEMFLTGNVHASFSDAWDIVIKVGVPYLIYVTVGLAILRSLTDNQGESARSNKTDSAKRIAPAQ